MNKFKIFGERNSGTNLLRHLVADNRFLPDDAPIVDIRWLEKSLLLFGRAFPRTFDQIYDQVMVEKIKEVGGWKHAAPDHQIVKKMHLTPVIVVKHPIYWLESFERHPFHHYNSSEIYLPRRIENIHKKRINKKELIVLKLERYLELLSEFGGIVVQYETLITEFGESKSRLAEIFGHCNELPDYDVRRFVRNQQNLENKKIHIARDFSTSQISSFRDIPWDDRLKKIFGYELNKWEPILPYTL